MKAMALSVRRFLILMSMVFSVSCVSLPAIKPVEQRAAAIQRCARPFLGSPHRFVHAIAASLPGGGTGTVLGITVFDPKSKAIRSAILTIEGFVLFDARYDKELHVYRALPPFNGEEFAERLMKDVRLIFLAP